MTEQTEQEWINAVKGDKQFGLLRYQLTFTETGAYGPINYTVRIRDVDIAGTVTQAELAARLGCTWYEAIEDYLRKQHDLPPADRRSDEQRQIDELLTTVARQEAQITELEGLMREAHGHLSIGLDVYDEIADALALSPATEEGVTT